MNNRQTVRQAFVKSIPVMAGYIVLGIGFGILLRHAGYGALWALPFVIFGKKTPAFIVSLGRTLPPALIGMLVVYCLKDTDLTARPYGLPELIAAASVVALQARFRNSLVSILSGTVIYMVLIRV